MALKQRDNASSDLQGPWGVIAPTSTHLDTLRFSKEPEEIISYAYRVITRWHWKPGPPETMVIFAGRDQVTITGHGLRRLMDALDEARLQIVRQQGPTNDPPETIPYIISIINQINR